MFEQWAKENNASQCPENVIAYLQIIGAIDIEKAREAMASGET